MKSIFILLTSFLGVISPNILFSQAIISQDFESPLTGWFNQGVVTVSQNSVTPHGGSAMLALNSASTLTSPTFSLPGGAKNLSFWLNSYNPTPFSYDLRVNLLQNGSPVLSLGSWQSTLTAWGLQGVNIPVGYSGNNFAVSFSVQVTDPNLKFYLDDISLSVGAIGLNESKNLNHALKVFQDIFDPRIVKIQSTKEVIDMHLQLFSLDGKKVLERKTISIEANSPYGLSLEGFTSGLYLIKVNTREGSITRKIFF